MRFLRSVSVAFLLTMILLYFPVGAPGVMLPVVGNDQTGVQDNHASLPPGPYHEKPDDPRIARSLIAEQRGFTAGGRWRRGPYVSIQVNVDALGRNIVGDAANEPSLAIDPTDPDKIVMGWRQFDTIASNFRQAGRAYSHDGGQTWTFPGVLEPGVFRSDPVLESDADGNFYYYSLTSDGAFYFACQMFKSTDGGVTWQPRVEARGGDKAWMAIDRTNGVGRGNIYCAWSPFYACCGWDTFTRSTDGGMTYLEPIGIPGFPEWGTVDVGPAARFTSPGELGWPDFPYTDQPMPSFLQRIPNLI